MTQQATGIEANVCADIAARQALGVAKYGFTVQDNPLTLQRWLQHAYEECLDQAVYLRRAMQALAEQPAPVQEPVATVIGKFLTRKDELRTCIEPELPLGTKLYTSPPAQSTAEKSELETVPANGGLLPAQQEPTKDEVQAAFEDWLVRTCPSGDVEAVQRQWETSSECIDLHTSTHPAQQEPVAWPAGLIERITAAEQRIQDGHAPRRIPADPTDVDLVLAEVRYLLEGKQPPFWVSTSPPAQRTWVGLTDEEVKAIFDSVPTASCQSYAHWRSLVALAIENKLREKNT